jgi:hypothetical protein
MKLRDLFEDQQTLEQALKDCEPYLNLPGAKNGMLFRGMRNLSFDDYNRDMATGTRWLNFKSRRNRLPSDTPSEYATLADDVFHEKFDWYPRTNGTFVTGNLKDSREYGIPHVVIPIGPTRYVWSPKVKDLFLWLTQGLGLYTAMAEMAEDERHAFFTAELKKAGYKDTDLGAGIPSGHEIMLSCDRYIAVRCDGGESGIMAAVYELTDIEPD